MGKIYGLFGAMTGKVADAVMVVRNGEQIVRKYQPVVSNPGTPAQIEARAKLKLMSQLSAVMSEVIAMPRVGAVSSRNLFTKANYHAATFSNNEASIDLNAVKLTNSVVGLPRVSAAREENAITVALISSPGYQSLSRVVYAAFAKQADGKLRYAGSRVVTDAGTGNFTASFATIPDEVVFYAYGVRDNNDAATVLFGNLEALTAESVAKLIVTSRLRESDITLTETRAITLAAAV